LSAQEKAGITITTYDSFSLIFDEIPSKPSTQAFPWDYKAAELGDYRFNLSTAFIDFCAAIGLAYDLKTVDQKIIDSRRSRTGEVGKYDFYEASMSEALS
jgi:hypothetical protein